MDLVVAPDDRAAAATGARSASSSAAMSSDWSSRAAARLVMATSTATGQAVSTRSSRARIGSGRVRQPRRAMAPMVPMATWRCRRERPVETVP